MGSEFTTEDVSTRRWEDKTYTMVGKKKFLGHYSFFADTTYYENVDCYVIEGKPTKKDWYYSKRIMWLHKDFGWLICDEVYDVAGKKSKNFIKTYEIRDNGCLPQIFLTVEDQTTHHKIVVGFNEKHIIFNTGINESFFSEKTLMRSKW